MKPPSMGIVALTGLLPVLSAQAAPPAQIPTEIFALPDVQAAMQAIKMSGARFLNKQVAFPGPSGRTLLH